MCSRITGLASGRPEEGKTMTRQQIVEGLEGAREIAEKTVDIIRMSVAELRADERANWGRLEAGLALAIGGLNLLSETTPAESTATSFTLHDVHHELMRRAVDAAKPDEEATG